VFKVSKQNSARVVALSELIFAEMNAQEEVIISYQILQKIDNPLELCWHLTWKSAEVAKLTTAKWPTFKSTAQFQALVENNIYYGHFVSAS